jgi:hypothetical protein
MAEPSAKPAAQAATPADPRREYRARHKIAGAVDGKPHTYVRGDTLRLTDAEAKSIGDAVEPSR